MKVIHFSDLHLGSETFGRMDPQTGLSTRTLDILKALDDLVAYAVEKAADAIIFSGDAYRSRDPSQTHQREFARRLKTLSEAGIPVYLLVGNHDLPAAVNRANTMEIFPTLQVDNVFVGIRPGITTITTRDGPLQVAALPWARRAGLLGKAPSLETGGGLDAVNRHLEAKLTETVQMLAGTANPQLPAVLVAHAMVSGATPGSEGILTMGRDPVLLPGNLAAAPFDYVALGHVHRAQCVAPAPPVCYAGSLVRLDFSDEGLDKGFYVIDIDPSRRTGERLARPPEFHSLETRHFRTVTIAIQENDLDPTGVVTETLERRQDEIRDAIVKLHITAPESAPGLNHAEVQEALRGTHQATISLTVERAARPRLGDLDPAQLTPSRALEVYLKNSKIAEKHRAHLQAYGDALIRETLGEQRSAP